MADKISKKEQHKNYYELNREKLKEYDKQRYISNKELKAKQDRERHIRNKEDPCLAEKERERVRIYREENKEEISRKAKEKRASKRAAAQAITQTIVQNMSEEQLLKIEEEKVLKIEESRQSSLQYKKEYREKNKEYLLQKQKEYSSSEVGKICKRKASWKKNGINITYDKYLEIACLQTFLCAVCGVHQDNLEKSLCVDHDHDNGKIRGLLCSNCNIAIGFLKEDENLLLNAINYLRKYK